MITQQIKLIFALFLCIFIISSCGTEEHFDEAPVVLESQEPFETAPPDNQEQSEESVDYTAYYYGFCKNGKWGILRGDGEIVVEPEYEFSAVLQKDMYLLSDNSENINTGKLYNFDGERLFPEYGDITVFGGGPDCNSAYTELRVFLYEENGLKGLMLADGTPITEAKYDDVRGDYSHRFYHTRRGDKYGIATLDGELTPAVYDGRVGIIGIYEVDSYSFTRGYVGEERWVYKGSEPFLLEDEYYLEQLSSCFLYYTPDGLQTLDEDLNVLYQFDKDIKYYLQGPDGSYSISGLLCLNRGKERAIANKYGELIIPFGDYSIYYREDLELLYTYTENSHPIADFYDFSGNFLYKGSIEDLPEYKHSDDNIEFYPKPDTIVASDTKEYHLMHNYFWWFSDGSHPDDIHTKIYRLMSSDIEPDTNY